MIFVELMENQLGVMHILLKSSSGSLVNVVIMGQSCSFNVIAFHYFLFS